MRTWLAIPAYGLLSATALVGCGAPTGNDASATATQPPAAASDIVAYLGDTPITRAQVEHEKQAELARVRQQEFEILEMALDAVIKDRLLENEAAARGISVDGLLLMEIHDKVPPPKEAEIRRTYEANPKRHQGRPLEEVRNFVVNEINRPRIVRRERQFMVELKQKAYFRSLLQPPRHELTIPATEPTRGPAAAPVTLVEFADFECTFCQKAHADVVRLLQEYGDRIRYVHRDFPLTMHTRAPAAARAARCAQGQGRFWDYHDNLMSRRGDLSDADLENRAASLGLQLTAFTDCYRSQRHAGIVQQGIQDGTRLGVTGTPTFFINGRILQGARPYEELKQVIEEEFARVRG